MTELIGKFHLYFMRNNEFVKNCNTDHTCTDIITCSKFILSRQCHTEFQPIQKL